MDTGLVVKPINKTICRVLGEDYNATVQSTLAGLKQKFIARAQRMGHQNPESAWVKAEPTYRNMLMNDPNIRQDLEQRQARGATPEQQQKGAPAAGSNPAQEIYSIADQIRSSVSPELQDQIHRIMELAMELANSQSAAAAA